jgi:hypothetical protein
MQTTTIRTVGKVDVGEEFEFVTSTKFNRGDRVYLKPQKPITSSAYGEADIVGYIGPGRDQSHRKYIATRVV